MRRHYELDETRMMQLRISQRLYTRLKCIAASDGQKLGSYICEILDERTSHFEPLVEELRQACKDIKLDWELQELNKMNQP